MSAGKSVIILQYCATMKSSAYSRLWTLIVLISPGIGRDMIDTTMIPRVHMNWLIPPIGPSISTGVISLTKPGQTTVKIPAHIPCKNLPKMNTYMLSVNAYTPNPIIIRTLVAIMQTLFPLKVRYGATNEPIIAPALANTVTSKFWLLFSSSSHFSRYLKTIEIAFHWPQSTPN